MFNTDLSGKIYYQQRGCARAARPGLEGVQHTPLVSQKIRTNMRLAVLIKEISIYGRSSGGLCG